MDKSSYLYIHGKGGNAEEAIHYKPLFSNCDVIGLDYAAQFPWEAKKNFRYFFNSIYRNYKTVDNLPIALGVFCYQCLIKSTNRKHILFTPVVDMERLIADMMIYRQILQRMNSREKRKNSDNLWRDPFLGIIFAMQEKSYYIGNPSAHFVW